MRWKSVVALVSMVLVAVAMAACSEDDIIDLVEYNLTIENTTASAYDVWINNPLSTSGFYAAGHLAANRSTIIHELDIGIDYEVNLTTPGSGSATPAIHNKTISSSDQDVTWQVIDNQTN
jgi:hypothetical protein